MKAFQKSAGFAAIYMAAAYLIGIVFFLFVLDYSNITNAADKVALLADKHAIIFATNLLMYVFFGFALVVFCLAVNNLLKENAPELMQVATIVGIIWAGSLIASGMVSNEGIQSTLAIYAQDPAQAAVAWQGYETVANGLGNGNGEILGGVMTLLIGIAGLRSKTMPKILNVLGIVVGSVGILSLLPPLVDLTGLFGVGQVVWFIWLGILLIRNR